MDIGNYSFSEFKNLAAAFHSYPAPGLLLGGYMVERARRELPDGILFEAIVETPKCLPDAVQLLTPCSIGNGWMKIVNYGRYALALYDKYEGTGFRVFVDSEKIRKWPELSGWFYKLKPKKEQDSDRLLREIEAAGDTICGIETIRVARKFLGKLPSSRISDCPICGEAFPVNDGSVCRGCQEKAIYDTRDDDRARESPSLRSMPVAAAVGKTALHDMTQIVPGKMKGAAFKAGQVISAGDVCRLQQMGKNNVFVEDAAGVGSEWVHENDAAREFARRMAGRNVEFGEADEGKVVFTAKIDGLLTLDRDKLKAFNLVPGVMCASRHGDAMVEQAKPIAGCRAIPLYLSRADFSKAQHVLGAEPIFNVVPFRKAKVGIIVTGTEVFTGLIEDKFIPVVRAKVEKLGCTVVGGEIQPDDRKRIADSAERMIADGADIIITTAGLSVDPDDVTRAALHDVGMSGALYGMPALPGAMSLVGKIGSVDIIGVPACAIFFKATGFDLILPRVVAGLSITRNDLADYAEGGFCLGCKSCTFPKCPFGK